MRRRIIIFDFDGTLVHSAGHLESTLTRVLAEHGRQLDVAACRTLAGTRLVDIYRALQPDLDAEALAARHRLMEVNDPAGVTVFPETMEVLRELRRDRATRIAINSSRHSQTGPLLLRRLRFSVPRRLIHLALWGDQVDAPKPDPSSILDIVLMLGGRLEDTTYVGDTAIDVQTGRRAGVRTVYVRRPTAGDARSTLRADHVVPDLRSLPAIVRA